MTSLRLALIIIGLVVVIVVALISYDKLRLRRIDRRRESRPSVWQEPVLVERGGARRPPPAGDGRAVAPGAAGKDGDLPELAELEYAATQALDLDPGLPPALTPQRPDEHIDFVARVPGDTPVPRDAVLGIFRQNEYLLDKHRRIYGFNLDRELWRDLDQEPQDAQFGDVELAIQLADLDGPIDESELNKFAQMGLKVADSLVRPIKFSMSFEAALERARELDAFAQRYDVLAIVYLLAPEGQSFTGRRIEQAARAAGMRLGEMNIFHRPNPRRRGGPHLFSMANLVKPGEFDPDGLDRFTTRGLTVFMNVPLTPDPPAAFTEMMEAARAMAKALDGRLTDQKRRPLAEEDEARIGEQVRRIAMEMTEQGIPPGGETALRLF